MHTLIVDDHYAYRLGLKYLLGGKFDGMRFSEADCVDQALTFASGPPVDLILVDLNMPGAHGMDALRAVLQAFPASAVVVVSAEENAHVIRQTYDLGARGFVPKRVPKDTEGIVLLSALDLVLAGAKYLTDVPGVWDGAPPPPRADPPPASAPACAAPAPLQRPDGLSERQFEAFLKAADGKANKVIAREMQVSESTVKAHLTAAYRVFGVGNRTAAASSWFKSE